MKLNGTKKNAFPLTLKLCVSITNLLFHNRKKASKVFKRLFVSVRHFTPCNSWETIGILIYLQN